MHQSAGIPDEYYAEFKRSFQTSTVSSTTNMMYWGLHFRLPAGLDKANLPVLVVVGNKEYQQMKQSGLDLLKALPQARGVMVSLGPKSSLAKEHNWAMTAADQFNATLKAWIEDNPLPTNLLPLK